MANTTIKISQLPNIGAANLTPNTLLPLVSTNGTFLTDKITVGNLANYVLTEAGNLLQSAFVSDIAYSVANAAQPNITSVGTLANLSIVDVSVLNIPGGNNGYVLQTNGDGNLNWTAMAGSGNGSPGGANSQIQFNDSGLFNGLPTLTFNAGTATLNTVNIAASDATIYGNVNTVKLNATGNVTADYFIGNGSQLTGLSATANAGGPNLSIQFNNDGTIDGNANLTYNVNTSTLNIIQMNVSTGGNIYENGNALIIRTEPTHIFEVWGNDGATDYKWSFDADGHLRFPGNGYVRGDTDLIQMYNNDFNQSGVSIFENFEIAAAGDVRIFTNNDSIPFLWTFDNAGNLTLPGNTFAVNYANGSPVPLGTGAGLPLANGNSNFDISTTDGNATITANSTYTWTFGDDGLLTLPGGNTKIGGQYGGDAIIASNVPFGVVSQGTGVGTVLQWSDDITNTSLLSAIYINGPIGNTGDIQIRTGNVITPNVWTFTANGELFLSTGNSVISSVPNNAGDGSGLSTLNLIPDSSTGDDRYLIVDPTGPNHLHLRAGGLQDQSSTALFLGGEKNYVRVTDYYGVRLQNELTNTQTTSYYDPADYTNGQWYTMAGLYYIEYTSTNPQLDSAPYQDINNIFVIYNSGTNSSTLTYDGLTQNLGGGTYRVRVVEAPPSEPTLLEQIDYTLNITTTNTITLENDDFNVTVQNDVTINGNGFVDIINFSNVTPVTIRTDQNGSAYTWEFGVDGNLKLPTNSIAINYANGSSAFGNMVSWTDAPVSNISAGSPGQAAYDSGGNLYVCVATDIWAKFTGTTSW